MRPLLAALVLVLPAAAAFAVPPPGRPLPEDRARGEVFSDAMCGVQPTEGTIQVPAPRIPKDRGIPENWKEGLRAAARDGAARLVAVRRLTDRIQDGTARIAVSANECEGPVWDRLQALTDASEGAARKVVVRDLAGWLPQGEAPAWKEVSVAKAPKDPVPAGRYSSACRAPDADADLYAPDGPALPADARAKLAGIARTAAEVSGALRAQKKALDELLPLLQGEDCREVLAGFDALTDAERRVFFDYREKAVAGAVWDGLTWKKAAP
jgi:hypothetical protein